jgi:2-polyprenyl-6-methoxyphenol hydroxylase-like FAD-dependent oxidoreductase
MKVIQLPPGFSLPDSDGSRVPTESERTYAIRGANNGFRNYVSLGLLPVRDPSMVRPANVITRPNHEVWELEDGPSAKAWFRKAFPRLNWDEYVDDTEWERFAKAKGTSFPYCQYSPGLAISSPDEAKAVVLVGDACHAFPPDIGQGINAGLCDVLALDRALKGKDIISGEKKNEPEKLGEALKEYEQDQAPQVCQ